MGQLRGIVWAFAILCLTAAGVSGCCGTENKVATAACGKAASNTACKACCGMHGSRVTSFFGNCKCY